MLCWCAFLKKCLRGSYGVLLYIPLALEVERKKRGAVFAEHPCMHKLFPFIPFQLFFCLFLMPRWGEWQKENKKFCSENALEKFSFHFVLWWRLMAFVMGQHLFLVIVFWSVQNYCLLPFIFIHLLFPSRTSTETESRARQICFFSAKIKQLRRKKNKKQSLFVFYWSVLHYFCKTFCRHASTLSDPHLRPLHRQSLQSRQNIQLELLLHADSGWGT